MNADEPEEDDELEDDSADFDSDEIDESDPEAVLEFLAKLRETGEDDSVYTTAEVRAWLDLGEPKRARAAVEAAEAAWGADDFDVLNGRAELSLALWELDAARSAFERLARLEPEDPFLLERLSLLADIDGDEAAADRYLDRATRAAPDVYPRPPRLSAEEFDQVLVEALEGLPEVFRNALESVAVIVDPVPSPALARGAGPLETPPDLLGLFVGRSLFDGEGEHGELPPTVYLFQRNLERAVRDRDDLVHQIRVTLFHEVGHALGFDEDGVEAMGLE